MELNYGLSITYFDKSKRLRAGPKRSARVGVSPVASEPPSPRGPGGLVATPLSALRVDFALALLKLKELKILLNEKPEKVNKYLQ